MNEKEFQEWLQGRSKAFREANPHLANPVCTEKPERVDRKAVRKAPAGKGLGEGYRLRRVQIEFHAASGQRLDRDNAGYVGKPILDALINLGFDADDREVETKVVQRMDEH